MNVLCYTSIMFIKLMHAASSVMYTHVLVRYKDSCKILMLLLKPFVDAVQISTPHILMQCIWETKW